MKTWWTGRWTIPVWLALTFWSFAAANAQEAERGDNVLQWTWHAEPVTGGTGNEVDLVLDAGIRHGWILYSSDFVPTDFGPRPARIALDGADGSVAVGDPRPVGASRGTGKDIDGEFSYTYFSKQATLRQRVRVPEGARAVTGVVNGQACFEESGLCTLVRQAFSVTLQ
ncbi:MAG TPA: hypothetical protein VNQ81_13630 [Povalibacter sp.]|nr:hypothetical protein [Povalibacter sp.]